MGAATMKISEYVVVIYNFQTVIANLSILVKKDWFITELISWPWEGAIQHKEFIIYNFKTLDSISIATTILEYCRITYASNMSIWTKFMTPYQNFVLPLMHFTSALCHPPLCSHTVFKETSILPYVMNVFIVSQLISLYDVNTQLLYWIIECVMYRVNIRINTSQGIHDISYYACTNPLSDCVTFGIWICWNVIKIRRFDVVLGWVSMTSISQ